MFACNEVLTRPCAASLGLTWNIFISNSSFTLIKTDQVSHFTHIIAELHPALSPSPPGHTIVNTVTSSMSLMKNITLHSSILCVLLHYCFSLCRGFPFCSQFTVQAHFGQCFVRSINEQYWMVLQSSLFTNKLNQTGGYSLKGRNSLYCIFYQLYLLHYIIKLGKKIEIV